MAGRTILFCPGRSKTESENLPKNDGKNELNRRLSNIEAFAYALPVLALLVPAIIAIAVPKNEFTRNLFGGWNAFIIVFALLGGAVWWSSILLQKERKKAGSPDRTEN